MRRSLARRVEHQRIVKRWLLKLGVFLLLGVVVNVAVAWGCAYWIDGLEFAENNACLGSRRIRQELPHYPEQIQRSIDIRDGPRLSGGWQVERYTYAVWIDSHGLPTLAMSSRTYISPSWGLNGPATSIGPLCDLQVDGYPIALSPWEKMCITTRQVPLRPLWPGFAINTIFYAAMLWLLWIAPGKNRRFIRIRGHRCPACGYQIAPGGGIGPVCSECGAALPAAWSTTVTS
jgi:hypothetical protein